MFNFFKKKEKPIEVEDTAIYSNRRYFLDDPTIPRHRDEPDDFYIRRCRQVYAERKRQNVESV